MAFWKRTSRTGNFGTRKRVRPIKQRPQARERFFEKKKKAGLFKRKINRALTRIFVLTGVFLIAFFVLGSVVVFSFFTIQDVRVSRKDFRADGEAIAKYVYNRYIGRNIFFLSRRAVEYDLRRVFPEALAVEVERQLPNTLRITVSTHPVAFRWSCERIEKKITTEGEIIEESVPEAFFVNIDGRITQPNPDESEVFLIFEKSPCPKELSRRTRILSPQVIEEVFEARRRLEEILKVKIDRAGYFRNANEVHFVSENETAIWVDFITPIDEQMQKLEAALTLEPNLKEPVEHIDLRIPEKIFYAPK